MRVNIQNMLKKRDFERLGKLLAEREINQIGIFSCPLHLDFLNVEPLQVLVTDSGYVIKAEFTFEEQIPQTIFHNMQMDDCMRRHFAVGNDFIRLSIERKTIDPKVLEDDITFSLKIMEWVINHTCYYYERMVEEDYIVDSDYLEQQIDFKLNEKERQKRAEAPKPFAIIHAKNLKEAKEMAKDLIPLYRGYDKHYLFEEKKEYWLLTRGFLFKLLNCSGNNMFPESDFSDEEKEVLKDMVAKNWIKKQVVLGIVCYHGMDERTEKYLKSVSRRSY
jgi:hypothetical protein